MRVINQLKIPVAIIIGFALFGFIVRDGKNDGAIRALVVPQAQKDVAAIGEVNGGGDAAAQKQGGSSADHGKTVVTFVVDGDTIELAGGKRVRLIGIDAPERNEPLYGDARVALETMVLGKEVRLEKDISDTDRYGRLLRYVYVGDVFINLEMVRLGVAAAYTYPPDVAEADVFVSAQREARGDARGMWASAVPTTVDAIGPAGASFPVEGFSLLPCATGDCDCADFKTHAEAQWFHERYNAGDSHRLDRDRDGRVCETLP